MTKGQEILLGALFAVIGLGFVLWLGSRESNRWQALQDRAEQAEARVNQPADPLLPYTRIPTAEIRCEEPADGYCGRYVLYRRTAAD
jgi:hypothetical protein